MALESAGEFSMSANIPEEKERRWAVVAGAGEVKYDSLIRLFIY